MRLRSPAVEPRAARTLQLLAAGAFLSWCLTVRLPAATPLGSWLLPSPDLAVLLALIALFAPAAGLRPSSTRIALGCAALLTLRLGRIADGICLRYLDRRFHVAADLPLVPEFARLALATLGGLGFGLALLGLSAACALLWSLSAAALRLLARELSVRRTGDRFLLGVGVLSLVGPLLAPGGTLFAPPITPRLVSELESWLTARGMFDDPTQATQRRMFADLFAERQARLRAAPAALEATGRVDVQVLLVEAYGRVVQSDPRYAERLAPSYRELAAALDRGHFFVCSDVVRSTVLGGNSWMTHATLQTAMPIHDQFEYGLLMEQPRLTSLATIFHGAGYRTISVKPGTTRDAPHTRIYGFDREYNAPDLGYRGPSFAWAPMPDQFVLQRLADLELQAPEQPLFVETALVSSHFPFNPHPPYVDDWASLADGSLYHTLPPVRVGEEEEDGLNTYALGYLSSLSYDLRVLGEFVTHHTRGDALVLILGDHQPIAPVAGFDISRGTPLHVISRREALLEPFRERGCVPGLLGRPGAEAQLTMEDLGIQLLRTLSAASGEAR